MKAQKLLINRLGSTFSECVDLAEFDIEKPAQGEVLIRNCYAGVNGIYDQMMCYDKIDHHRVVPPANCGVEAVGVVSDVGEGVTGVNPGDAVSTVKVGHGYTTHHTIPVSQVTLLPKASPEFLCLNPSGVSALLALEKVAELQPRELVCISAAAGGLGNMLTQLALHKGAQVVAICGQPKKGEWLLDQGVARVIDYKSENISDVLDRDFKDSLDVALDSVGGEVFDAMLRNLAPHGRLVVCGFTSDRLPTERISQERVYTSLYWKAASIRGFMNYRFQNDAPDALSRLVAWVEGKSIRPLIHTPMFRGLNSVSDAVDTLLKGENMGKVVVDLTEESRS